MSTTTVRKSGKVFQAGDYADKGIALSADDLRRAATAFKPVNLRLEHRDTIFNDRLGQLVAVRPDRDPADLFGEADLPSWFTEAVPEDRYKVSLEWDKARKEIVGCSIVLDPRIENAALFAAFSADIAAFASDAHMTPTGQKALQYIHNQAVRGGAVCNPPAGFAAAHEALALQHIHDLTVGHGAQCAGMTADTSTFSQEAKHMTFREKVVQWFAGGAQGDPPLPEPDEATAVAATTETVPAQAATATPAPAGFSAVHSGTVSLPDPEMVALKAEVAKLKRDRIQAEAIGFADTTIAAHRAFPTEREALIAAFSQAAMDDGVGAATFSDGKSRVQLLRDATDARPDHAYLTRDSGDVAAVFNQSTTAQAGAPPAADPERVKVLLGMTPTGKAALANQQN